MCLYSVAVIARRLTNATREGEKTLIGSNDEKNYSKKTSMACSRFEYVKRFERDDRLLPGCWIVLRIDGRGFTK